MLTSRFSSTASGSRVSCVDPTRHHWSPSPSLHLLFVFVLEQRRNWSFYNNIPVIILLLLRSFSPSRGSFLFNTQAEFLEKCFLCSPLFHHSHFYFQKILLSPRWSWSKNKLLLARLSIPGVNDSFRSLMMIHEARLESESIPWKFSGERFSPSIFQNLTRIYSAFRRWEHTNHISCLCRRVGTRFYLAARPRSRSVWEIFRFTFDFMEAKFVFCGGKARSSIVR